MDLKRLSAILGRKTGRASSWDTTGRNDDAWNIEPGERRVLADIAGPGTITHLWMTQRNHYRECLLLFTWDNAASPSIVCPLGDFFGLGHGIVNSYHSLLFSASTRANNQFNQGCALNAYVPMPFRERALVELVNESEETHRQYFYVDYEQAPVAQNAGYLHAEFRRANPFPGWGGDIRVNTPPPTSPTRNVWPGTTTTSSWIPPDAATTSAATCRSPTSRARGGARATT